MNDLRRLVVGRVPRPVPDEDAEQRLQQLDPRSGASSETTKASLTWIGALGAGDGDRTRIISLGIGSRSESAGQLYLGQHRAGRRPHVRPLSAGSDRTAPRLGAREGHSAGGGQALGRNRRPTLREPERCLGAAGSLHGNLGFARLKPRSPRLARWSRHVSTEVLPEGHPRDVRTR
jgi:hypothetical protein